VRNKRDIGILGLYLAVEQEISVRVSEWIISSLRRRFCTMRCLLNRHNGWGCCRTSLLYVTGAERLLIVCLCMLRLQSLWGAEHHFMRSLNEERKISLFVTACSIFCSRTEHWSFGKIWARIILTAVIITPRGLCSGREKKAKLSRETVRRVTYSSGPFCA
jgi:hypothetical protein